MATAVFAYTAPTHALANQSFCVGTQTLYVHHLQNLLLHTIIHGVGH